MKTIWLVTAVNGGHEAGWPVRAFSTRAEAESWAEAEEFRVRDVRRNGGSDPESWVDGHRLSVEEVPFGEPCATDMLPHGRLTTAT